MGKDFSEYVEAILQFSLLIGIGLTSLLNVAGPEDQLGPYLLWPIVFSAPHRWGCYLGQ